MSNAGRRRVAPADADTPADAVEAADAADATAQTPEAAASDGTES